MSLRSCLGDFKDKLFRKKKIDGSNNSDLIRTLSLFSLVCMGVGSTLGAGAYVLTGSVDRYDSGPAILISFAIAAFSSLLAGFCYAEFGARVPRAGSAYVYSYVTVGELWGFIIGWNLVLEYIIGVSSVARAWSANLDSLVGGVISNATRNAIPMNINGLASYPDFVSVGIILIITLMLSLGMKTSSAVMTILTIINLLVLTFSTILGYTKADIHNWQLSKDEVDGNGNGGFMPYGFSKVLEGAATCFYAFVGFDVIACVGEEAKNPSKSIPRSIILTLLICFLGYAGVSTSLSLMQPYYLTNIEAPLPEAFKVVGYSWASKPVAVGSMVALTASLLGAAVGMPRIVFSMARDGLLFQIFAKVASNGSPVNATLISGFLSAIMALMFDLNDLVNMMSIGTLMAYILVAASVLLLRYKEGRDDDEIVDDQTDHFMITKIRNYFNISNSPNDVTTSRVLYMILFSISMMIFLSIFLIYGNTSKWWEYLLISIFIFFILSSIFVIVLQPQSRQKLFFKTPMIPWIPCLSIFINIYLMLKLPAATWIRFAVWMIAGFIIYFSYGIRNSRQTLEEYEEFENKNFHEAKKPNYGSTD